MAVQMGAPSLNVTVRPTVALSMNTVVTFVPLPVKYRHVFVEPPPHDARFENLRLATAQGACSSSSPFMGYDTSNAVNEWKDNPEGTDPEYTATPASCEGCRPTWPCAQEITNISKETRSSLPWPSLEVVAPSQS